MIKLTLLGEPKSTNHLYKSHCRFGFPTVYMTKDGKALKESYQWQVKSQYRGEVLTGDVKMEVRLFFGTKRRQDIDNFQKICNDSLTDIVFQDDSQITELHLFKDYCKENPRVEIIINEI